MKCELINRKFYLKTAKEVFFFRLALELNIISEEGAREKSRNVGRKRRKSFGFNAEGNFEPSESDFVELCGEPTERERHSHCL